MMGFTDGFGMWWMSAWVLAWVAMLPVVLLVAPIIQRAVMALTVPEQPKG